MSLATRASFAIFVVLKVLCSAKAQVVDRFRFNIGSCHDTRLIKSAADAAIWTEIAERQPDGFIWGGDNIYGDQYTYPSSVEEIFSEITHSWELPFDPTASTPAFLRLMYENTTKLEEYVRFVDQVGQENIVGTWDDHDVGLDDSGKDFQFLKESQQAFLDFFKVPLEDPRRTREGVYSSSYFNAGTIKVILLDNRFHKDSPSNVTGDFLGREQWRWLQEQVNDEADSTVELTLIVSGLQVLPDDEIRREFGENWSQLRQSRQKLLDVLSSSSAKNVVLISGDVHHTEMLAAKCVSPETGESFILPELTTSGMTHSWSDYHFIQQWFMSLYQLINRSPYQYKNQWDMSRNFGEIDLDLGNQSISLKTFSNTGNLLLSTEFSFAQLKRTAGGNFVCGPISPKGELVIWILDIISYSLVSPSVLLLGSSFWLFATYCGLCKCLKAKKAKSLKIL